METWNALLMQSFDKIATLEKKLEAKKLEVTKRREVVEIITKTDLAKKKDDAKIETLDTKIAAKVASFDETINYYRSEIQKAQARMDEELRSALMKYEEVKAKTESKFETYRQYCQEGINQTNNKRDIALTPFEKKKELLQQTTQRSEDDDKVLVRLKIEEQQLDDELKKSKEEKNSFELKQAEAMALMRETAIRENALALQKAQEEQRQRDLATYQERKAMEEQDIKERRERNQQRYEREQQEKEEKEREKNERRENLKRFTTTIKPMLTDDELITFTGLYKESSDLYQDLLTLEDYPAVKEFLESHKPDLDMLKAFEDGEYKKLTKKEQMKYDNIDDYDVKLKLVKLKTKEKRREFLQKL